MGERKTAEIFSGAANHTNEKNMSEQFQRHTSADYSNDCMRSKNYIDVLMRFLNKEYSNDVKLLVMDTHRSACYFDKSRNEIVCDVHFFDICRLLAAALISDSTENVEAISSFVFADFYVMNGEIDLALEYARQYSTKKDHIYPHFQTISSQHNLLFRIVSYTILHEFGHSLLCCNPSSLQTYKGSLATEFESQNEIARTINSIDISPIIPELDALVPDILPPFNPISEKNLAEKHSVAFMNIVFSGAKKIKFPDPNNIMNPEYLMYACDNYLKHTSTAELTKNEFEDDCACDLFSFNTTLNMSFQNEDTNQRYSETILAYFVINLAMNIITSTAQLFRYPGYSGYSTKDYIYNRMKLEVGVIEEIIFQYTMKRPMGVLLNGYAMKYYCDVKQQYDRLYADYCEYILGIKTASTDAPYVSLNTQEGKDKYNQIVNLLEF